MISLPHHLVSCYLIETECLRPLAQCRCGAPSYFSCRGSVGEQTPRNLGLEGNKSGNLVSGITRLPQLLSENSTISLAIPLLWITSETRQRTSYCSDRN